ncbi:hypothetical protein [Vibrio chagasii]|uniref:hypothetical protein n=1 Tax=Vibrio chagasii TaxID=170679 RepID=UPI002284A289|nr:hypothetical protein [Vibrio chagasii]MCY9827742.1 hypothetical protein [Vibrio chagasii]
MPPSNIEAVFLLLAQLPTRYPKSLESLCDVSDALGIGKSPDTIRRWLNILVDLGYAEKTQQEGKDCFKRATPLPWVTAQYDSLMLTLIARYFTCLLPESTQLQYQALFEQSEMNAQESDTYRQWLRCIEVDLPTEHTRYHSSLKTIKLALIQNQPLRFTLIGQCLNTIPTKLRLSTQGLSVFYLDNQQLKQTPMLSVLSVSPL